MNATGWTLSPGYVYNNTSVSGKKFTFTGSASGLLGIRVTGRVHISESTGSWEASAREITAFSGSSARNENGLMVETENLSDNSTISVYPNPANSNITVEFNRNPKNEQVQVDIIDLVGRRVYGSGILSSVPSLEINLRGYTKGNYIIQVSQGSHRVSKKLAIE